MKQAQELKKYHGTLDPQAEQVLEEIAKSNRTPLYHQTPEQARQNSQENNPDRTKINNTLIHSRVIGAENLSVSCRIYSLEKEKNLPVVIYLHGGGFVFGGMSLFDQFCAEISEQTRSIVVSIDYSLAPEQKFPVALNESFEVTKWIFLNTEEIDGDPQRIVIAGDSAGANLAAVITHKLRDETNFILNYQILICPYLDLSSFATESYKLFRDNLWLSQKDILWFRKHYLKDVKQANLPEVSPLYANDFKNLPPALIITAECDVLRDQGRDYAIKLQESNNEVTYVMFEGMLHGFPLLSDLFDKGFEACNIIIDKLQTLFRNQS